MRSAYRMRCLRRKNADSAQIIMRHRMRAAAACGTAGKSHLYDDDDEKSGSSTGTTGAATNNTFVKTIISIYNIVGSVK